MILVEGRCLKAEASKNNSLGKTSCTYCHSSNHHKNSFLNKHAKRIDCQVCHLPKLLPTLEEPSVKLFWSKLNSESSKSLPILSKRADSNAIIRLFWSNNSASSPANVKNHIIDSKNESLRCNDCHSNEKHLDWKALGYKGDPKNPANR